MSLVNNLIHRGIPLKRSRSTLLALTVLGLGSGHAIADRSFSFVSEICGGAVSTEVHDQQTDTGLVVCTQHGVQIPFSPRLSARVMAGVEFAPLSPSEETIGGNGLVGELMVGVDYRLPIVAVPRLRFFVTPMISAGYGSYSKIHVRRFNYTWERFDDVKRFEATAGVRTSAEYRLSRSWGLTGGGYCDWGLNPAMNGCRLAIGLRY